MITRKSQAVGGILLKAWYRPAGSMDKDGKKISWDAGYQIVIVPFEEEHIQKHMVRPDCVDAIKAQLDTVHWGCLIELELDGKKVKSVEVVTDSLKEVYANN